MLALRARSWLSRFERRLRAYLVQNVASFSPVLSGLREYKGGGADGGKGGRLLSKLYQCTINLVLYDVAILFCVLVCTLNHDLKLRLLKKNSLYDK